MYFFFLVVQVELSLEKSSFKSISDYKHTPKRLEYDNYGNENVSV